MPYAKLDNEEGHIKKAGPVDESNFDPGALGVTKAGDNKDGNGNTINPPPDGNPGGRQGAKYP